MPRNLTPEDLRFVPPNLREDPLIDFVEKVWRIKGHLKALPGERDQNFRLTTDDRERYVLKIGSPVEDLALVDYQVQALLWIETFDASIPVPRLIPSSEGARVEHMLGEDGKAYAVRLLNYVPGTPLREFVPPPLGACRGVGRLQGHICEALRGFAHEAQDHFMPWDAMNGLVVTPALCADYLPEDLRTLCAPHLERLEKDSLPRMHELPAQVIHNDAHTGNVLCKPDNPGEITGIIDFGDLAHRPILTDLATSLASFFGHADNPLAAAQALVHGFNEIFPIPREQLELLYDAMMARAILTVQLLTFRARHANDHGSLVAADLFESTETLQRIMNVDPDNFLESVAP